MHMSSGRFSEYHSRDRVEVASTSGQGYASKSSQFVMGPACSSMKLRPPSRASAPASSAFSHLNGSSKSSSVVQT